MLLIKREVGKLEPLKTFTELTSNHPRKVSKPY